jgi:hypothetical protein
VDEVIEPQQAEHACCSRKELAPRHVMLGGIASIEALHDRISVSFLSLGE